DRAHAGLDEAARGLLGEEDAVRQEVGDPGLDAARLADRGEDVPEDRRRERFATVDEAEIAREGERRTDVVEEKRRERPGGAGLGARGGEGDAVGAAEVAALGDGEVE